MKNTPSSGHLKNTPKGWMRRRSGLVVPQPMLRRPRASSIGKLVVAATLLASPVAHAVTDISRAAVDVVTAARTVLAGNEATSSPGCDKDP